MNLSILLDTLLCLNVLKMSLKGTGEENKLDLAGKTARVREGEGMMEAEVGVMPP